jgi:hypothetical protein
VHQRDEKSILGVDRGRLNFYQTSVATCLPPLLGFQKTKLQTASRLHGWLLEEQAGKECLYHG